MYIHIQYVLYMYLIDWCVIGVSVSVCLVIHGVIHYMFFSSCVAKGLQHLRTHNFIHRDIKPGNIMRCQKPDGR